MKKLANVFLFILLTSYLSREMRSIFHWDFLSLASNLSAQSGWSEDQRLVFMQGAGWYPKAACNGDTIHLVWWQAYIAHDEVFYKRSTDAGKTWGPDVLLSIEDTQSSIARGVAVVDSVVHVIWHEYNYGLLYRRSINGGETWLNIDSIVPGMGYSSICATGDTVYIAGTIGSLGVLRFTKSFDSGNSWEPIQEITSAHDSPTLRIISNNVLDVIVSYEYVPEIYNVRSFDGGQTWLDSQLVSEGIGSGSQEPAMDTDDSNGIHITWYDYKYSPYPWTGDIFYRASRDSGNTWEQIDSLTVEHRAVASDILAEGSNLHLVWEDDRHGFNNNFEIYYRMSTDLGQTWGSEVRQTDALYHSYCPSLACGSGYLHLFWQDRREYGNNGSSAPLYYKRKDLSGAITEGGRFPLNSMLKFNVYPNPFGTDVRLLITDDRYKEIENIKIFDVSGKEVMVYEMKQKEREIRVDCKDLAAGVYFLQVEAGDGSVIKKVVKVR